MRALLCVCLCLPIFTQAQTFTGGSGPILDFQTIDVPLSVSGLSPTSIDTLNFGLETVCFDLTHTYLSDLTVSLIAPDGTNIQLFTSVGGGDDDMIGTCLNEDAPLSLGSGSAPFTGTYQPMGQMGLVNNGQNPNGIWYLRIYDSYGADEGTLNSWSITFGNNPATYFSFSSSQLPIVVINTNGQTIPNEPKIEADMGIIYNGPGIRNYMSDPYNNYDGKIGIERRGNYSNSLPQKPYSIKLIDALGMQVDSSLLGMPAEHDWVLLANYNDKSFARNILPFRIFDEMGHWAPRNRLVDVVINGEYMGIYLLAEQIKKDSNRVDIATVNPDDIFYPEITGGYILKIDYWDNQNSWLLNYSPINHPTFDVHMVYVYPKPDSIAASQKTYIQDFIDDFETSLYGPSFADPVTGFRKYLSIQSWLDYFIVNEVARNGDGFKKSRYFYKEKDPTTGVLGKLKAGPVWDFDWAWKDMWDCMYSATDGSAWAHEVNDCNPDVHSPGWVIRMLQDPYFADELRCRYEDLRRNLLSKANLHAMVDSVALLVDESQVWHYQTWGNMGVATGTPEVPAPSQSYAEEVQRLKDWIDRRLDWLDLNMPGTLNGCSMTGVSPFENSLQMEGYPNPFGSALSLKIESPFSGACTLRLIDQRGRLLREVVFEEAVWKSSVLTMKDLEDLANGLYLVEVELGAQKNTLKFTKH
jgi:subtilisin-like proprotein convertase family protein